MGNDHLEELLINARRSRTPATQQAVVEDAGTDPEVDGAAGGDGGVGGGDGGGGDGDGGDPAVARDPKKYCWNCGTPGHALKLSVCSGCNRVSYFVLDAMFRGYTIVSASFLLLFGQTKKCPKPRQGVLLLVSKS